MFDIASLVLFGIALVLAAVAARRSPHLIKQGVGLSIERFLTILPRIGLALIAAGFISRIVPSGPIAHHIGPDSGIYGILLASLVGGFIPSGPIVSFPIVVVLLQAGAGIPQIVAFLSAWSVVALHRVFIYEIPLMGWRFSALRLAASAPLAPLSGLIAEFLIQFWPAS
jgi:uncharacterized membrane protein YraQ (UPF0718 family)